MTDNIIPQPWDETRGAISANGPIGPFGLIGLSALVGLFALAACSNEAIEEEQEPAPVEQLIPIAFSAQQGEEAAVTRSESSFSGVATTFTVYGYKNPATGSDPQTVFDGFAVEWQAGSANTTTSNSSGWEYVGKGTDQTIKYWDWSVVAYRFFAVAVPSGVSGAYGATVATGTTAATATLGADATEEAKTPYYTHLWYSTGVPPTYSDRQFGQPVKLVFLKPFAKVRFLFTYMRPEDASSTTLSDKSFSPTDNTKVIARKGTFTATYPLTGSTTTESWAVSSIDNSTALSAFTNDNYEYTVLPVTGQGTYTLSVSVNGGTPQSCVVPADYMEWLPGYQYTYIFKISAEGGVELGMVNTAYTDWENAESADYSVYNW